MNPWLERQCRRWEALAVALRRQLPQQPLCALIAGSGIGAALSGRVLWEAPCAAFPGFPCPSVEGHRGVIQLQRIAARPVLVFGGRVHLYEGYGVSDVVAPVVCAFLLGIHWLVLTNAAGSLVASIEPGMLLVLRDVLNCSFRAVPVGPEERSFRRLALCAEWRRRARARLARRGFCWPEGTYGAVLGPSYETPAEVRMLQLFGADAVGMSTVHELQCATALGMRTFGVSIVTNWAAGLQQHALSHAEVLAMLTQVARPLHQLLQAALAEVPYAGG